MGNQPHVHSVEETKSNIAKIEHNSSGPGSGPSGKKAGPPTGIEGGSSKNYNTGTTNGVPPKEKGADTV